MDTQDFPVRIPKPLAMALFLEAKEKGQDLTDYVLDVLKEACLDRRPEDVFLLSKDETGLKRLMKSFLNDGLGLMTFELPDTPSDRHRVMSHLESGFTCCKSFVVLLTADDEARLKQEWVKGVRQKSHYQPRPNVLLEVGMGLIAKEPGTILVQVHYSKSQLKNKMFVSVPTDVRDVHHVDLGDYDKNMSRNGLPRLIDRLTEAGCQVRTPDDDELSEWADRFAFVIRGWTAENTKQSQGLDFQELSCGTHHTRIPNSLEFEVSATSRVTNWRAGFLIGQLFNPADKKPYLRCFPDGTKSKAFLFHTGLTKGKFGIAAYKNYRYLTDDDPTIKAPSKRVYMGFERSGGGRIRCFANDFVREFPIPEYLSGPIYLVAWGDGNQYTVTFENLTGDPLAEVKR